MIVHDISPLISEKTAVFPGDQSYSRNVVMDFPDDHLALSSIQTTVHIGAHVDAPNHYRPEAQGMHERDLSLYYGPCQVISVTTKRGESILRSDFSASIEAERVLFKTNSFPNPEQWNSDFCSLSADLVQFLAKKNVRLVGIDTPSIDPETSKLLEAHQAVADNDMAILEGVVLSDISDGLYDLCAFPLKLKDADASPVRAVLIERS